MNNRDCTYNVYIIAYNKRVTIRTHQLISYDDAKKKIRYFNCNRHIHDVMLIYMSFVYSDVLSKLISSCICSVDSGA